MDRGAYDPKATGKKVGGLEVKCPYCNRGMTVEEAYKDPNLCLYIDDDGVPKLKFGHKYYYQVQGQMFVCDLAWVDFVVWLCGLVVITCLFNVFILIGNGGTKRYYPG